jgi:protein-tyrosine phosphatase
VFVRVVLLLISSVAYSQHDRTIHLDGTRNTRQLGGIVTQDGRAIKQNILIRSDNLCGLSPQDCYRLAGLGLKTVIDIRSESEVEACPDVDSVRTFVKHVHIRLSTFGNEPTMAQAYLYLFRNSGASIREFFDVLADPDRLPLLFHCQWGKDRAGIMSALILRLLDVPDNIIVEDYLLSREAGYWAQEESIRAILEEVDSFGGIEAYLLSIGVAPQTMEAVRRNLLEDPSFVPFWAYK